jgi:diaminopimelate decarboxylase
MNNSFDLTRQQIEELAERYGTPLYLYDEKTLRTRCREMKQLVRYPHFKPNYSAKANSNIELLRIIRSEGLSVDAMSPGEIVMELEAGFTPEEILFVSNNVSLEEFTFAVQRGIAVSVDSLSQLETFGRHFPGEQVAVRINPGIGAGHHKKVVTGGKSKFGIMLSELGEIKRMAALYKLTIIGLNMHIGSLFLEDSPYLEAVHELLNAAKNFTELKFIDFGGGFGVPYHGEDRLDLTKMSEGLNEIIEGFVENYPNKELKFMIEPGRYVVAECGLLIGRVHSVKVNYGETYVGTDIGMNVLMRPALYDAYHGITVFHDSVEEERVTVVGNICETGDVIAKDRLLPRMAVGDLIVVETAGAYGYSMSSNYNARLRPAEVLLQADQTFRLIRKRDTLEELVRQL